MIAIVLAKYAPSATPLVGYSALALLIAGTALFYLSARSDPQGGLIAFSVLPAQWLVAWAAGRSRFVKRDADAD